MDRAITDAATEGFIKLVTSPGGKILGATVVGARAGEMVQEYVLAMKQGLTVQALSSTIHAYPTLMLANRRAADMFQLERLNGSWGGRLLKWWVGRGQPGRSVAREAPGERRPRSSPHG